MIPDDASQRGLAHGDPDKAASLEPWFGPHYSRDIYLTLLHQENPKVPDSILKAALIRRATEDIRRIVTIKQAKGSLQQLLQRGSIGDDLWTRFTVAEAEIEEVCPLVTSWGLPIAEEEADGSIGAKRCRHGSQRI